MRAIALTRIFLTAIAVTLAARSAIALVGLGVRLVRAEGSAAYAAQVLVTNRDGICQRAEPEPLRSLKGVPKP